jgi:hypothetical protein
MLPIGINDKYAIKISCTTDYVEKMLHLEKDQFQAFWEFQLASCTFKGKYNHYLSVMLTYTKMDPFLKPVVESVLRNPKLLEYKLSLPDSKPQKKEKDMTDPKMSNKCLMHIYEKKMPDITNNNNVDTKDNTYVYISRLCSKKSKDWKALKIHIPYHHPGIYLHDHYLVVAYYVHETTIKVVMYDLSNNQKVTFEALVYNMKGYPKCITNGEYIVVSDGFSANIFHRDNANTYRSYMIESEIITAINVNKYGDIIMGTFGGCYYRVSSTNVILYAHKHISNLCITGIVVQNDQKILVTTITGVYLIEGSPFIQWNGYRPLCGHLCDDKVLIMSKYGVVRILTDERDYKMMENDNISIIPYYNALYTTKDVLYILCHNGTIITKKINYN